MLVDAKLSHLILKVSLELGRNVEAAQVKVFYGDPGQHNGDAGTARELSALELQVAEFDAHTGQLVEVGYSGTKWGWIPL